MSCLEWLNMPPFTWCLDGREKWRDRPLSPSTKYSSCLTNRMMYHTRREHRYLLLPSASLDNCSHSKLMTLKFDPKLSSLAGYICPLGCFLQRNPRETQLWRQVGCMYMLETISDFSLILFFLPEWLQFGSDERRCTSRRHECSSEVHRQNWLDPWT